MKLNAIDWIVLILLIIGGLNWGLVGFFNYNLVSSIFGEATTVSRIIYGLVGLSAIYMLFLSAMVERRNR
jgi:uncharacterized membrane protein YuzA (DUF378 family)